MSALVTRDDGLTADEGVVMDALVEAVGVFNRLPRQHPDELRDFVDGIHRCQEQLALRVCRRAYPEGWPAKQSEGEHEKICPDCRETERERMNERPALTPKPTRDELLQEIERELAECEADRDRLLAVVEKIASMDRQGYALRSVDVARAALNEQSEGG